MDIYREEILEHWQNPQNWGTLADFDFESEVINLLCGDRIKVQVKLSTKNPPYSSSERSESRSSLKSSSRQALIKSGQARTIIEEVRFTGTGCAISIASASILSENIKNKPLASLKSLKGEDVLKMIGASNPPAGGGFPPARLKCAFLALEAVKKLGSSMDR